MNIQRIQNWILIALAWGFLSSQGELAQWEKIFCNFQVCVAMTCALSEWVSGIKKIHEEYRRLRGRS